MTLINKTRTLFFSAWTWLLIMAPKALAVGGIEEQSAEDTASSLVTLVKDSIQPLGALIILVAIVIAAVKIIITANKPEERAKAMESLPYILVGGVLLGGAMLISGFVVGLMGQAGGN